MAHAKEPLTRGTKGGGSEITDRAKTKLRGQIARADRIIRTAKDSFGKVAKASQESHDQAVRMRQRAYTLLGETPPKPASPGKSPGRTKPISTKTKPITDALVGVAKRALRANQGE